LLGLSPTRDRRIYFDASPISHAITANNKTAVFLMWGTEDDVVDYRQQSLEFLNALKQAEFQARPLVAKPYRPADLVSFIQAILKSP